MIHMLPYHEVPRGTWVVKLYLQSYGGVKSSLKSLKYHSLKSISLQCT